MSTDRIFDAEAEELLKNSLEDPEQNPEVDSDPVKDEEQDTPNADFNIPEKFKNADRETVIKSYLELEKTLGHKAQELGELRKLADEFLRKQLEGPAQKPEPEPELTFDDIVERPGQAITKAVEPKLKSLEDRLTQYERQIALAEFQKKHPDFQEVGTNPEFIEWVKASPYRVRQYIEADQKMDLEAADDLLTTWKERQSYLSQQTEQRKIQEKQKRDEDLKKLTLESGSTGEAPKKIYRRIDLINLRISDPDKFDSMYEEISRAYQEGRVK